MSGDTKPKRSLSTSGWLLDCGNSAIKLCYADRGELGKRLAMGRRSYETDRMLSLQQLRQATASYPKADFVVACMAREEDRPLIGELASFLIPGQRAVIVSTALLRSMKIHYTSGQPGADRIANAFAVRALFPGRPAAAVDFGTATNIAVVNAEGGFAGGAILAGPTTQLEALNRATAGRLPEFSLRKVSPESIRAVGDSTEGALTAGLLIGAAGAVRLLIEETKRELGAPDLPVVVTGGHLTLLRRFLPEEFQYDESLTFQGLLAYLDDEG